MKSASVTVLMCTHQGERFLSDQLKSIFKQDYPGLALLASDDGSDDDTRKILERYQFWVGKERISIQSGPEDGFVANFHSLICHPDIESDYFAYADQDDIWEADKLSRAIAELEQIPEGVPALYCTRTALIDETGRDIGFSPLFEKPPSFANALVQNVGGGNTMVMNKAARDLLCACGDAVAVSHDWWAYILTAAAGGAVIYDSYPSVRYRQHNNNMVGSNNDWRSRLIRLRMLLKGRFREWNNINTRALQQARHLMTPENQVILDTFCTARNRWLIPRMWGVLRSGVYRQTFLGNLGLIAAAVMKKL
ncbi:glycosyltransferase family 2 protein [Gammaproteobacteria bacterium]|nr:glycosyltransferase family 2 protein [Gammaproteobacteria bacterium]